MSSIQDLSSTDAGYQDLPSIRKSGTRRLEVKSQELEQDILEGPFTNELRKDAAVWRIGSEKVKKAGKRKQESKEKDKIRTGRKAKKSRMEKLVNWGEAEEDSEQDLRSWLTKSDTLETK